MDTVIWVDENDVVIGEIPRSKAHEEGLLHRIAVVYVVNERGEILVQERMSGRFDHSSAGHVDPGETYESAAKRELTEELDIKNVALKELLSASISYDTESHTGNKVRHMYRFFEYRGEPQAVNYKEMRRVFWQNPMDVWRDMQNDMDNKKYTGGFKSSLKNYLKIKNIS
ncbi:NUDIX domain-containing protein [Candidatus Jorgensenbacteria bacterium]|nr:NUDIX domain-containing protein [Candidatus Jorgensenbacteria bacterium]